MRIVTGLCFALALATAPAAAAAQEAPMGPATCNGDCHKCGIFNWYRELETQPIGWNGDYHNYPFPCADVDCPNPCVQGASLPDEDALDGVAERIRNGDIIEAKVLLANTRSRLTEDGIEVLGCDTEIMAFIQVPREQQVAILSQSILSGIVR